MRVESTEEGGRTIPREQQTSKRTRQTETTQLSFCVLRRGPREGRFSDGRGGGKQEKLTVDIVRIESWFGLSADSGQRGARHCYSRAVAKVGRRHDVPPCSIYLHMKVPRGATTL